MGIGKDNECVGVNFADKSLQLRGLTLFHGGEENVFLIAGVKSPSVQHGYASVEAIIYGLADFLKLIGNDDGHGGIIKAIDYGVYDYGANIKTNGAIKSAGEVAENKAGEGNHEYVYHQHQLAHGLIGEDGAEKSRRNVAAAGAGACQKYKAKSRANACAAEDGGHQRLKLGDGYVLRKAQEEADQLVSQQAIYEEAKRKCADMVAQTKEQINNLRKVSNDYMDDALRRTEEAIALSLEDVRDTRSKFMALVEAQEKRAVAQDIEV